MNINTSLEFRLLFNFSPAFRDFAGTLSLHPDHFLERKWYKELYIKSIPRKRCFLAERFCVSYNDGSSLPKEVLMKKIAKQFSTLILLSAFCIKNFSEAEIYGI